MIYTIVGFIVALWLACTLAALVGLVVLDLVTAIWRRFFSRRHDHIWPTEPIIVMRCQRCGVDTELHKVDAERPQR